MKSFVCIRDGLIEESFISDEINQEITAGKLSILLELCECFNGSLLTELRSRFLNSAIKSNEYIS